MFVRRFLGVASVLLVISTFCGCGCKPTNPGPGPTNGTSANSDGQFILGDLIAPFAPPTLADLDKQVEWVPQPVVDSTALLRERLKSEPAKISVAEALALRNRSAADNEKLLSVLGRLPESDAEVNWNASITRHSAADVKSTNGILASSTVEFDISSLTGFGLFSFDWTFKPFAASDVVVSWHSSKDGLYDKVVMRDDLTWSDGKPITAHDVAYSFRLIMSSKVPVPAQRSGTDKLKWVEAYDDRTVVYFHKESLATNVWNVNFSVVPKHVYEGHVDADPTLQDHEYFVALENNPIGGGAYTIAKRVRNQEIVLAARDSWFMHGGKQVRDKPYFREIRFKIVPDPSVSLLALKAGDLDEMILNPEQWQTQTDDDEFYKKNTKAYGLEWVFFYFNWNCDTPFFSDKRVRQAMSYAFDHEELLGKLRYGLDEPCTGIFHPTSRWASKIGCEPFQRNIGKAEKLLEEADWIDHDGDGIRDKTIQGKSVKFEFTILVSNRPDRIAICNLLKENLGQIGVLCNVRPTEFTVLQDDLLHHKFQAAFGGWGTGTDPDTSENIWGTDQDRNYGKYSNPRVDELFALGRKEFDPEKRAAIYQELHRVIYEDQPYTFLYHQNAYYAFSKQLRGYVFSPRGPYHYAPGFGSLWKLTAQ